MVKLVQVVVSVGVKFHSWLSSGYEGVLGDVS